MARGVCAMRGLRHRPRRPRSTAWPCRCHHPHRCPWPATPSPCSVPLFTESRRPLPAAGVNAAAQAPAAPDELEKSQLLGLISGPSFVGIMARIDGQVRTVRRGDNIGPWTLRAIRDREVVFTQGDHERVLKLEYARGGADQAAAAAAERAAPPAPVAPAPTSARAPIAAPPPAPATAAVQPPAARPTSPAPAASPGAGPAWSLGARSAPRQPTASAPAR